MSKLKLKEDVEIQEKEAYISRELGAIIINYETSKYYETNDTATFIIKLLQSSKTEEEIIDAICDEYTVDRTAALEDFNNFIDKLKRYGLVEE